jgi:hypothetical protein
MSADTRHDWTRDRWLMRARPVPHLGEPVTVLFLAASVSGVIEHVDPDQQRLRVLTDEGEQLTFALNRATGRFVAEDGHSGARLAFGHSGELD